MCTPAGKVSLQRYSLAHWHEEERFLDARHAIIRVVGLRSYDFGGGSILQDHLIDGLVEVC